MSRSFKRTPITGITTAVSEKEDKKSGIALCVPLKENSCLKSILIQMIAMY